VRQVGRVGLAEGVGLVGRAGLARR
jgi:hypothetical protein